MIGDIGGIALIVINAQSPIAFTLVSQQTIEHAAPQKLVDLIVHIRTGPIDGLMDCFDGTGGDLNQAIAGPAILQGLDVIVIQRKAIQIGKLGGITEHAERQIVGKLSAAIEILGEVQIGLWSCMDIDGAEEEDLIRAARRHCFRDWFSGAYGANLTLLQPMAAPKK